jgi:MFS family permease
VVTFAAEELPAKARGYGFGFLGMMLSLGFGWGAIQYSILEPMGVSWRWMYVLAVPPLILITFARRRLPESRRFTAARDRDRLASSWTLLLKPPHRRMLILASLVGFLIELPTEAGVFALDFLQEERGFSASAAGISLVLAGLPGIPLMVRAGALSDRFGRRIVGSGFMLLSAAGGAAFFWVPASDPLLVFFMAIMTSGSMGGWPILAGMVTELFPTALRSQATSTATGFRISGQAASLFLGGALLHLTNHNFPLSVTILSLGVVAAVVIVMRLLPDTHGEELEMLTGEAAFVSGEAQPTEVDPSGVSDPAVGVVAK